MDIEFGRHVIRVAFSSGREMQDLIHLSKDDQKPKAHKAFVRGIAKAITETQEATTNKAFAAFPELEVEVDIAMKKYGRY